MHRFTALTFVLAVTAAPIFACDDGNTSEPPGFDVDAGNFEPTPQPVPDAAPADTGTDAAPRGVIINAVRGRAPQANVRVIFHDAQGAVLGEAQTDATGRVTRAEAPSMITIVSEDAASGPRLLTYVGIEDGDVVTAVLPIDVEDPLGTYNITYPVSPGSSDYDVSASDGCGTWSTGTTATVSMFAQCVGATGSHVLVTSNSEGGRTYSFAKGLTPPAGGATVNVPTLPSFTAPLAITLRATGLPTEASINSAVTAVVDGLSYYPGFGQGFVGEGDETWPFPNGFADGLQTYVVAVDNTAEDPFGQAILRRDAAPTAATTVAFDWTTALPKLNSFAVTPSLDGLRPTIAVGPSTSVTGTDGGYLQFEWERDMGSERIVYPRWTFVVPPGTTSVQAPSLPAGIEELPTAATELWPVDAAFVEASQLPGYAQLKSLPVPIDHVISELGRRPLPVNGVVRLTFRSYAFSDD